MKTFEVELGKRSYPIYIGTGLLLNGNYTTQHIHGDSVFIVSNEVVAPLYLDQVLANCKHFRTTVEILPDGEQYKTIDTVNQIFDSLLKNRHDRNTTLIALGGGVIGDITGFAAATYQRGVNFIQIPTTLLAQVDSSVGGKTGVNHVLGKNMIGAFYQPQCVISDHNTLQTLDERELCAGIAEVIKYGLIRDKSFFEWLEKNLDDLLTRNPEALSYAIYRSCENKAQVVKEDELEQSGIRALLNYGHTFGHAIETGTGYGSWLHGEAVACGMLMAARLCLDLGWINENEYSRIKNLLVKAQLPTQPPDSIPPDKFLELMAVDKKSRQGKLYLVLLKSIGNAVLTSEFSPTVLKNTLQSYI